MKEENSLLQARQFLARHHPSAFLLAAQLGLLVLYAAFSETPNQRALINAFGVLVLAFVVWVVNRSPGRLWFALILAVITFVLSLLSLVSENPSLIAWSALIEAVLYFYAAGSLIAYMMEDYRVTTDELFAAGATFTLLAWAYAYLYQACQVWIPGSFTSATSPVLSRTFIELLFLSSTNLSATGLGDIMPVTPPARILVILEQFSGVGYIAVVVSRLIGLTIRNLEHKRARLLGKTPPVHPPSKDRR